MAGTDATSLTDWLAEVHAADERAAQAALDEVSWYEPVIRRPDTGYAKLPTEPERRWALDPEAELGVYVNGDWLCAGYGPAAHIARHDPQSVLARIEGERAVLRIHWNDDGECDACSGNWLPQRRPGERQMPPHYPCPTLRALAWGYRHRDGYRAEEWALEGVTADA